MMPLSSGRQSGQPSCSGYKKLFILAAIGAFIAITVVSQIQVTSVSLDPILRLVLFAVANDPGIGALLNDFVLPTTVNIKVFQINKIAIGGLNNFHPNNNTRLTYGDPADTITAFLNVGITNVSLQMDYVVNLYIYKKSGTFVARIDEVDIEAALQVPTIAGANLKISQLAIKQLLNYRLEGAGIVNSILNSGFAKNLIIKTITSQGLKGGNKALGKIKMPFKPPQELPVPVEGFLLY